MNVFEQAKKLLPSDKNKRIEQSKFTYSPLEKALKNKQRSKLML